MSTSMGRYELLGLLGRGGMAEVYLARRRSGSVEKRLVVKRVRRERAGDARALDLLIREARLSMSLAHQNVVTVFDFGRIDDDVFLVMEHVEGRDLDSTLARPGASPMAPVSAAHVAAQCCMGLDHAHRRLGPDGAPLGLVHRDVTPGNILVSQSGEVKLADFGVAGTADERGGRLRGTAAYMAPEQARGEAVDARADLYGLGLVLWEMLAGRRARPGTLDETLALARAGTPPPPLDMVPAALGAIVARATAAVPADRYPAARDMLADLDAYLVTARAAVPGPTLSDGLAGWFAAAWAGAPSPLLPLPAGASASVAEGATMRSMAVTAVEDEPAAAAPADPAAPAAPELAGGSVDAPLARNAPPRRSRVGAIAIGGGFAVALALAAWGRPGARRAADGGGGTSPGPAAAEVAPTAAATLPPDQRGAIDPGRPSPVAGVAAASIESPPGTAAVVRHPGKPEPALGGPPPAEPPTRGRAPGAGPGAGQGAADAPGGVPTPERPQASLRAVTIGAQPWANFTVDSDPTVHQTPETVHLTPGEHRVRFHNPPLGIVREVTLDVPADRDLRYVERLE